MLQTRSDEECSIPQHHLISETIVRTNLPKNAADALLTGCMDLGGAVGWWHWRPLRWLLLCCSLRPLCFHVQLLSMNVSIAGELCFCAEWSDQRSEKRFHGNLSAGLEAHRWSARSRDGGQIKTVISNMPLLDWRGIHTGTCYWLISPKEELEALTGMRISHLTTELQSWLHHKPANMAVVDVNNWPGMCTIPALDVVCDSQGNLFMF